MAERIAVTTHDLEVAVPLRDRFEADGFDVELLTAGEKLADASDAVLLVVTGGLDEKRARRLLREAHERGGISVIGVADSAADAVADICRRRGYTDCFAKPVQPEEIALVGRRLVERRRLREETGIVGETEAMREVLERVVQIAPVNATALVTGESGTGKELVARGIHALSPRRHRPFIAANVAALSETLLESELFGHEKGSFTGAIAQRKGLFELANRGTLFLDEIGEMPLATQTKLLRVLEEQRFYRVGGEEPISVDVRVIAATNQPLRQLVDIGEFRRDLYYRLNVLHIELPPLRDRREDIPVLIEIFARRAAREHERRPVTFEPEALDLLLSYDWPGNVRELRNLVESIVVLAPSRSISAADIPDSVRQRADRPRNLLPAPLPRSAGRRGDAPAPAPELEFIFRTLLELRMDVEDLRREFEEYRRSGHGPAALPYPYPYPPSLIGGEAIEEARVREDVERYAPAAHDVAPPDPMAQEDEEDEEGVVVYRPGMTMDDLERQAIIAALEQVRGNRRQAAEMLGIGERTLYRKIKQYEIPL